MYSLFLCASVYRILLVQETFLFKTTEKGFTPILSFHFLLNLSYLKYLLLCFSSYCYWSGLTWKAPRGNVHAIGSLVSADTDVCMHQYFCSTIHNRSKRAFLKNHRSSMSKCLSGHFIHKCCFNYIWQNYFKSRNSI